MELHNDFTKHFLGTHHVRLETRAGASLSESPTQTIARIRFPSLGEVPKVGEVSDLLFPMI